MAVRWLASIPSVTCSAVEAEPNPLGPGLPVTKEIIPISPKKKKNQNSKSSLLQGKQISFRRPSNDTTQREEQDCRNKTAQLTCTH